ncbi:MAG: TonB-dependent receptor [Bryobacteraceae bacterium]|nr:TonB-dependent receptor [Bryobacteraceae bacterium]
MVLCQQAPPPVSHKTSVTVAGRVEADAPASVTSLARNELSALPGVNADDRLRLVPGFTLFRRSSSLVANPTTQGVSLRGIGSTGASRTLVLWDGIPVNDPFGGWVQWTRLAPDEMERIEVSRGASTSLFGDRAMGGAIGLFTREAEQTRIGVSFETGNRGTVPASLSAARRLGSWAVSGSGRAFTTDGYYIVPEDIRGTADARANVRFSGGNLRLDRAGQRDRLFLRADIHAEQRDNGTRLQQNSTSLGTLAAHYSRSSASSLLSLLGFHTRTEYRASFSSITSNRNVETLTSRQSVPADATGGAALYRWSQRGANLSLGADLNRAEGYSLDTIHPAGFRSGGGVQWQYGLFTQGDIRLDRLQLFGGLRRHMAGARQFWSPSGGAAVDAGRLRLRTSAYRAFRSPTLNELHREFRAGNVRTLPNAALKPESLEGVEAGFDLRFERTTLSATAFRNSLNGLVTNVTRSVTGSLITRQRDNAASALSRGVELSVTHRRGPWLAHAAWLLADSSFSTTARLPQVPRNQGSALLTWSRGGALVSGGLRASSLQFEDDLNTFILPGFAVWHLNASHPLAGPVSATFAIENAFNRAYLAGFTPTPMLAASRLYRAGLRFELPR